MAKHDISNIRVLIGEQNPILRNTMIKAIFNSGLHGIVDCAAFSDVVSYLKEGRFDLLVINSEIENKYTTTLIRDVRSGKLHNDPFLVVLLVLTRAEEAHIKLAINSGADDILLAPFSPDQLMQRVANVHERRKPFIVTHDYIGPDRRRNPRPDEASAASFPVPNPCLARSSGVPDGTYREQMLGAIATLGQARVRSLTRAAEWELRTICKMFSEGGMPADLVSRLHRVDKLAAELLERVKGRARTDRIDSLRQQCLIIRNDPKQATRAGLIELHETAKQMVIDRQFNHAFVGGGGGDLATSAEPSGTALPSSWSPGADGPAGRHGDITYALPPQLAHLLKHIEFQTQALPPPKGGFKSFEQLCAAAIVRRIDRVVTFFQRTNAEVIRPLPPIFLLSPMFAEKFRMAVAQLLLPDIQNSRQVRMLAANLDLANVDTDTFWDFVPPLLKANILDTWTAIWDELRLIETKNDSGARVLQVKDSTKKLREILQPVATADYDLPRIGNYEIDIFKSLLDPAVDWRERLTTLWKSCQDLYEQEKDPRVFQQKVREGALRDKLLTAFNNFPDQWGDFVILACHRVFPRIDSQFLERFSTNLGRTEDERETHMPYLIRYLRQVREHPEIRRAERDAESEWQAQEEELRQFFRKASPTG